MGLMILIPSAAKAVNAYTSYLSVTEAEYILCRGLGHEIARSKIEKMIRSRCISFVESEDLHAGQLESSAKDDLP